MTLKPVYDAAEKLIDPKYRDAFLVYAETGKANEEFIRYIESDPNAQKAVDMMFNALSEAFEELGAVLRQDSLENKIRK